MNEKLMERFKTLNWRIFDDRFLKKNHGMIPNFVFPYRLEEENDVYHEVRKILKRESEDRIIEVNLFEVFKNIFDDEFEELREFALEEGYEEFAFAIAPTLNDTDSLITMFRNLTADADAILITGVGTAYPFVHISSLLKRLGAVGFKKPIVVFYPGTFDGERLKLFDKIDVVENEYQISQIT